MCVESLNLNRGDEIHLPKKITYFRFFNSILSKEIRNLGWFERNTSPGQKFPRPTWSIC